MSDYRQQLQCLELFLYLHISVVSVNFIKLDDQNIPYASTAKSYKLLIVIERVELGK